ADAEAHPLRRALDDLFFENDRMIDSVFEIQVRIIAAARERFIQIRFKIVRRDVVFLEEDRFSRWHLFLAAAYRPCIRSAHLQVPQLQESSFRYPGTSWPHEKYLRQ